jgi:hypothetical protein
LKTHIFDGEAHDNLLVGLHSQARKTRTGPNRNLEYSAQTVVNNDRPYRAGVRTKLGDTWFPKHGHFKVSGMFPAAWTEADVTSAIEKAYDNKVNYRARNIDIGNAKGIPIVFAGRNHPSTIYPRV